MITRTWHGKTHSKDAARYLKFLLTEGTQGYRETAGNLSVRVWQAVEGDICHFWTITEWRDIESVKAFAGDDYEKARYYPFDQGMLLEFEERVNHYESFIV
jgi:heme-degrading monooxygenase HmoA